MNKFGASPSGCPRWLLAVTTALLLACQPSRYRAELFVFGTLTQIEVVGLAAADAEGLLAQVGQELQQLHQQWHAWEPGELDRLNQALADRQSLAVSPRLAQLLRQAQRLERASLGTFNPAIGNLIRSWGFHTSDYPVTGPPPTSAAIERWLSRQPSLSALRFSDNTIGSTNPAVRIDLGGIGKGAAVDLVIERARQAGASAVLVNAGGDLRAYGRPAATPWRIAIRDPLEQGVLTTIEVQADEAIFTSGNYARYRFDSSGDDPVRHGHIIDPRNGRPVEHVASATVIASSGTLADAAATALVVAGPKQWREVAAGMAVELALLVDQDGCVAMTPAMARRVELAQTAACEPAPA